LAASPLLIRDEKLTAYVKSVLCEPIGQDRCKSKSIIRGFRLASSIAEGWIEAAAVDLPTVRFGSVSARQQPFEQ
jgi:hypothetical protein